MLAGFGGSAASSGPGPAEGDPAGAPETDPGAEADAAALGVSSEVPPQPVSTEATARAAIAAV
ncbi:hypothetical protein GCM10009654_53040 [Streptomyces hebeiensis]|uniref:Uncharacterized protein n=1 Tax=Streptomyces hebeiensis TaxID=229486 RepID=A0ABN1V1K6_9ACTN